MMQSDGRCGEQGSVPTQLRLVHDDAVAEVGSSMHCCCWCFCCSGSRRQFSREFCNDLYNRKYWTGHFCKDYCFHIANFHPVLSIFFCHPQHPYRKLDRACIFVIVTALSVMPACLVSSFLHPEESGDIVSLWNFLMKLSSLVIIFFYITLPVMILQMVLEKLATLDFKFQDRVGLFGLCRHCFWCLTCCSKWMKRYLFFWAIIFTVFVCLVSTLILHSMGIKARHAVLPFLISRIQSLTIWFATDLLMPWWGFIVHWRGQRQLYDQ